MKAITGPLQRNGKLPRRYRWLIALLLLGVGALGYDRLQPVDLNPRSSAQVVVDSDGIPLRAFADAKGEWRYQTRADAVSPDYIAALLGYEDRWFYYHPGVNPFSLMRAAWQWLTQGRVVSGGSTLTMQVARIRYGGGGGLGSKLIQIVRALQIEFHYSKAEILDYYLNHAPFGGTLQGVEAASRSYFGYSARDLTQAQAALLAVLPQAPSRYRPDRYPERAQRQRDKVLARLQTFGILTADEVIDARLETVQAETPRRPSMAPLLARRLVRERPQSGVVESYIDRDLQQHLETMARERLHLLPARASLAIMVMEHKTAEVVAYLGSADWANGERFGHIDMVTAARSPGSTLKPFIYGLAIDEGLVHSESLLMDVPLRFGDYRPQNFHRGFSGPVSVQQALQESLNLPAVQLLEQLGAGAFYARLQSAGAGFTLPRGAKPNLALALGGVATNLEGLVSLYSALANDGQALKPRFDRAMAHHATPLMSPGAAWIVREMLRQRERNGSLDTPFSYKTGTSFASHDAWAVGVGKHHTVGVWVGRPDNAAMVGHFGSFTAVPILSSVMAALPRGGATAHQQPGSVTSEAICWPTGQSPDAFCDLPRRAWVLDKTLPVTLMSTLSQVPLNASPRLQVRVASDSALRTAVGCAEEVTLRQVAVWPEPLQNWIDYRWRNRYRIPRADPRCVADGAPLTGSPVEITGIVDNARIKRHATTTVSPQLDVRVVGGEPDWYWFLNGRVLSETSSRLVIPTPEPGAYQLSVTDQAGMNDRVNFIVEP